MLPNKCVALPVTLALYMRRVMIPYTLGLLLGGLLRVFALCWRCLTRQHQGALIVDKRQL